MIDPATVAALVRGFDAPSDQEALQSRDQVLQLLASAPEPFSRRHFTPGHITGTGLVLAPDATGLLLVHHRRLDRWLPPGGHVEPADASIADAARREVIEETGVSLQVNGPAHLVGIDVHGIPARRSEPYHLHHDLLFLFHATAGDLQVSPESRAVAWCQPDEFDRYAVPANVRRAYARVLSTD
ncbi:MAG: NUDIX domain-containing protein [Acidobacteriia bacterium]|nr:NUDIX domain-containing protein [Terriglobia bacterium]